jgi:hypothetical protein
MGCNLLKSKKSVGDPVANVRGEAAAVPLSRRAKQNGIGRQAGRSPVSAKAWRGGSGVRALQDRKTARAATS